MLVVLKNLNAQCFMASHQKVELIQSGRKMQWSTYWQRHVLSLAAIISKRGSCIRTNSRVVSMLIMLMHLWASLFVIAHDSLSCSLKCFQANLQILNSDTSNSLKQRLCRRFATRRTQMTSNFLLLWSEYTFYTEMFFFFIFVYPLP